MIIDAYPWLVATLLVSLVIAFGGDYESTWNNRFTQSCPVAVGSQTCIPPSLGGLTQMHP